MYFCADKDNKVNIMEWTSFWHGIQYIFEEILFIPLDALRTIELDSWWLANIVNIIFFLIAASAFIYWMKRLGDFRDDEKQNAAHSAH